MLYLILPSLYNQDSRLSNKPLGGLRVDYPHLVAFNEAGHKVESDDDLSWALNSKEAFVRVWRRLEDSIDDDGSKAIARIIRDY